MKNKRIAALDKSSIWDVVKIYEGDCDSLKNVIKLIESRSGRINPYIYNDYKDIIDKACRIAGLKVVHCELVDTDEKY